MGLVTNLTIQKVERELTKIINSGVGRDEKFSKLFSLIVIIESAKTC